MNEMPRLDLPDLARDGPVLGGEEELPHDEPVEPVDLGLHADDFLEVARGIAREHAEGELLHPRGEVVQPPEEAVEREARRLRRSAVRPRR